MTETLPPDISPPETANPGPDGVAPVSLPPGFRIGAKLVFAIAAFLAFCWLAGFVWFASGIPTQVDDETTETDAIVVLTGGSERLETGLALLAAGQGRKLFVSGVYRGVDVAALLRLGKQAPRRLECCIALGHMADSTIGNADETAAWMKAEGFSSLRLVTANYHMRRSLMEFRRAMPGVTLIAHPVFPDHFKQADWWRWRGTTYLIASEYTKYLLAVLLHWADALRSSAP